LCLLVETLSSSDDGVRNGKKNDLDQFDTDNLVMSVGVIAERM